MKLFVVALLVLMAYVSALPQKRFLLDDLYLSGDDCEHSSACDHCPDSQVSQIHHLGYHVNYCCRTCGKTSATVHVGNPHSILECACH